MENRFNTIAGWVLGSGVVALALSSLSYRYFEAGKTHAPEKPGYAVEGGEGEGGGAKAEVPFETLLASADVAKGEATFKKCMSCHTIIDPPGFALETFDVIGGWRDFYRAPTGTGYIIEIQPSKKRIHRGLAVEVGYTMPDGRAFADVDGYKALLLENKDSIASALTEKLLTYATGARVQFADRDDIAAIVKSIRTENYGLRSLIHRLVHSCPFLNK